MRELGSLHSLIHAKFVDGALSPEILDHTKERNGNGWGDRRGLYVNAERTKAAIGYRSEAACDRRICK